MRILDLIRIRVFKQTEFVEQDEHFCHLNVNVECLKRIAEFFHHAFPDSTFNVPSGIEEVVEGYFDTFGVFTFNRFVADRYKAYLSYVALLCAVNSPISIPQNSVDDNSVVPSGSSHVDESYDQAVSDATYDMATVKSQSEDVSSGSNLVGDQGVAS